MKTRAFRPHASARRSEQAWETAKNDLIRLWRDENRDLKYVMKELHRKFGLEATERQYKSRIKRWDLEKNVKDTDMLKIASVYLHRRHVQDKSSCFYVRGRLVPLQKITRYLRRKGMDRHSLGDEALVPLPPHIRCVTPRPSSVIDIPDTVTGEPTSELFNPYHPHVISPPFENDSLLSPSTNKCSDSEEDSAVVHLNVDAGASSQSLLHMANNQTNGEKHPIIAFPPINREEPSFSRFANDKEDGETDRGTLGFETLPSFSSLLHVSSTPHSMSFLHPSDLVSQPNPVAVTSSAEARRPSLSATGSVRLNNEITHGTVIPRERPALTDVRMTASWPSDKPVFEITIMPGLIETRFVSTHFMTKRADLQLAPWLGDLDHLLTDRDGPFCHDINSGTAGDLLEGYHDGGWNESQCPSRAPRFFWQHSYPVVIAIKNSPGPFDELAFHHSRLQERDSRLYFHHFVTFVSRTLGSFMDENNPFHVLLPGMALQDTSLFNMMLVFAARHRAFLLAHPEPKARIARWMQSVRNVLASIQEGLALNHFYVATMLLYRSYVLRYGHEDNGLCEWSNVEWASWNKQRCKEAMFLKCWFTHSLSYGDYIRPYQKSDMSVVGYDKFSLHGCRLQALNDLLTKVGCDLDSYDNDPGWCPLGPRLIPGLSQLLSLKFVQLLDTGAVFGSRLLAMQAKGENQRLVNQAYCLCVKFIDSFQRSAELDKTNAAIYESLLLFKRGLFIFATLKQEYIETEHELRALLEDEHLEKGTMIFPLFILGASTKDPYIIDFITKEFNKLENRGLLQVQPLKSLLQRVWRTGRHWLELYDGEYFGYC